MLLAGKAGKAPCSGGRSEEDSNGGSGSGSGSWGSSNRRGRGGGRRDCRSLASAHLAHHRQDALHGLVPTHHPNWSTH